MRGRVVKPWTVVGLATAVVILAVFWVVTR